MPSVVHQLRDPGTWTAAWTQAVTATGGTEVSDVRVRIRVRLTLQGSAMRFTLSNRFGTAPLLVGAAAVTSADRSVSVLFRGRASAEIPAGEELISDALTTAELDTGDMVVHLLLPGRSTLSTGNIAGAAWSLSDGGDHVATAPDSAPTAQGPDGMVFTVPTPFLCAVEILTDAVAAVVVCLGDSITAAGWPGRASTALTEERIVLLNRGIPGNRLRRAGAGPAAAFFGRSGVDRFDDDVLRTAGVTHVVLALGTNDLGHPGTPAAPLEPVPTTKDLVDALDGLIRRSESAGITPLLATITPFLPAAGYDDEREQTRKEVNDWIRTVARRTVLDFDQALRSLGDPSRLATRYDSGDHLHPNDSGQDRLAEEIVRCFRGFTEDAPHSVIGPQP